MPSSNSNNPNSYEYGPLQKNNDHIVLIDISFILRCSQVQNLFSFYIILSLVWILVCAAACLWTLWLKPYQSMYLQRLVLVFPVLKALHTLIITANMALCSDQEAWETVNKYLIMGLISFETLFETVLLTIFLVLAKGWGIIRFYVMRDEATHVTIALGTVYLHYSAFFVTIEIAFLNKLVKYCLAIVYCILFYLIVIKYLRQNMNMLNTNIRHAQSQLIPFLEQALILKREMITFFTAAAVAYIVDQLLNLILFSQFTNQLLSTGAYNLVIMHNALVTLCCICCLLYALRSREWPPYFQLNVYPLQFGIPVAFQNDPQAQEIRQRFIPNILEMKLRRKDIQNLSLEQSFDSRQSYTGRQIAIVNPFDESKLNHSSVDDEKFEEIMVEQLKLAQIDKRKFDPNEESV